MECLHCSEVIEPMESDVVPVNEGTAWMHRECLLRSVLGSEDHIRRGAHPVGTCLPDDPRLTKHEAAYAAVMAWRETG